MERVPLAVVAITAPIEPSTAAMIANATSASIRVNPASPSDRLLLDNLDASGQPVDANLIAEAGTRQRDGASARHPRGKEIDRAAGVSIGAARRQIGIEHDVGGKADDAAADAGADRARRGIDLRR